MALHHADRLRPRSSRAGRPSCRAARTRPRAGSACGARSTRRRARSAGAGCACRRSRSAAGGSPRSSRGRASPTRPSVAAPPSLSPSISGPESDGSKNSRLAEALRGGIVRDAVAGIGWRRAVVVAQLRERGAHGLWIVHRRRRRGIGVGAQAPRSRRRSVRDGRPRLVHDRALAARAEQQQRGERASAALNHRRTNACRTASRSRPTRARARRDRCRSRPCGDRSATG